ncbi:hypothetical protein GCM10007989_26710 [Devosia pacifica]|uniref:YjiS-like domain-containing protein n=1 Tax=Devosia pacifica TaxID=1335967 RepID=A0A918S953_9HYPH|nr:DUF1127 domain-containing protein [Devosia pacifica]GHA29731.1 hypothetical protein GCM10007989_26710 [Devosia pacifica]
MSIRNKFAEFAQYHRTMRELNTLDTRQLRDLGITRSDFRDIARGKVL